MTSEYAFIAHGCEKCKGDLLWDVYHWWYVCTSCGRKYHVSNGRTERVKGE